MVRHYVTALLVTCAALAGAASASATEFVNLSTRGHVGTGDAVLIGGLIIDQTGPKTVLIRGRGPSLPTEAVPADQQLRDPVIQIAGGESNDNWADHPRAGEIPAGFAPSSPLEAAIVATLPPGGHTVLLMGASGGTGVGLFEVFDLDAPGGPQLINISTRGEIREGDGALIGGFVLSGSEPQNVFIRAGGPSIDPAFVPRDQQLADPNLRLVSADGSINLSNDNWANAANSVRLADTLRPGHPNEAGLLARIIHERAD